VSDQVIETYLYSVIIIFSLFLLVSSFIKCFNSIHRSIFTLQYHILVTSVAGQWSHSQRFLQAGTEFGANCGIAPWFRHHSM